MWSSFAVALFVVLSFIIDLPSLFTAMESKSNCSVTLPLFCGWHFGSISEILETVLFSLLSSLLPFTLGRIRAWICLPVQTLQLLEIHWLSFVFLCQKFYAALDLGKELPHASKVKGKFKFTALCSSSQPFEK